MNESLMKHGAFSWSELMTTDVDAAKQFYGTLFGWETEEFLGTGTPYTLIKVNGEVVGGMMAPTPECTGKAPAWGTATIPSFLGHKAVALMQVQKNECFSGTDP